MLQILKSNLFTLLILIIALMSVPAFAFDNDDRTELWTAFINGVSRTSSEVATVTPEFVRTSEKYANGLKSAESLVNIMLDSMPSEKSYMRKTLVNYRQALRSRHKASIIAWSKEIYRKNNKTKYLATRRASQYSNSLTDNDDQLLLLKLRNTVVNLRKLIIQSNFRNIRNDKKVMAKLKEFDESFVKTTKLLTQKRLSMLKRLRVAIRTRNKTSIMLYSQDFIDDMSLNRNIASTQK